IAATGLDFDDSAAWHSFASDSVPKGKKKHGGGPSRSPLSPPCPRNNPPPRGAGTYRNLVCPPPLSNAHPLAKNQPGSTVELSHRMLPARNKSGPPALHNRAIPSFRAAANYNPFLLHQQAGG